ncbi:hypothetical protein ACXHQB_23635 [Vibrio parahaemolyticus]|uniref:hypothetical protein n=1 Tax=Vibrio parahaemolyticus TaxID=670 RepID=UPI001D1601DD|nr:hypothetical protein [Vibrio parahaemolyticus]MCC3798276.1 hypothetical protein [Vibrio parahaemolyticus]
MTQKLSVTRAMVLDVEFREYTQEEKIAWAKKTAAENAKFLTENLGYEVNERLPYVLLQAATLVVKSISKRSILKTRICDRSDHYANTMKVLATAILHYDLASNLVGLRNKITHKLERCENSIFAERLRMAPRTVDNCIYTLKRSGLYLSFEQREEKDTDIGGRVYRGVASIKRLNMVIFEMLGLGQFVQVQRAKAKQRKQIKQLAKTPEQEMLDSYRKVDDKVREKRNKQRAKAKFERITKPLSEMLASLQARNRTRDTLNLLAQGLSHDDIKALYKKRQADDDASVDGCEDIPY